jgi:hypothetical protein
MLGWLEGLMIKFSYLGVPDYPIHKWLATMVSNRLAGRSGPVYGPEAQSIKGGCKCAGGIALHHFN